MNDSGLGLCEGCRQRHAGRGGCTRLVQHSARHIHGMVDRNQRQPRRPKRPQLLPTCAGSSSHTHPPPDGHGIRSAAIMAAKERRDRRSKLLRDCESNPLSYPVGLEKLTVYGTLHTKLLFVMPLSTKQRATGRRLIQAGAAARLRRKNSQPSKYIRVRPYQYSSAGRP